MSEKKFWSSCIQRNKGNSWTLHLSPDFKFDKTFGDTMKFIKGLIPWPWYPTGAWYHGLGIQQGLDTMALVDPLNIIFYSWIWHQSSSSWSVATIELCAWEWRKEVKTKTGPQWKPLGLDSSDFSIILRCTQRQYGHLEAQQPWRSQADLHGHSWKALQSYPHQERQHEALI